MGRGALEVGDLGLRENGSKRSGTLVSKAVAFETAARGRMGTVREYRRVNGH